MRVWLYISIGSNFQTPHSIFNNMTRSRFHQVRCRNPISLCFICAVHSVPKIDPRKTEINGHK